MRTGQPVRTTPDNLSERTGGQQPPFRGCPSGVRGRLSETIARPRVSARAEAKREEIRQVRIALAAMFGKDGPKERGTGPCR